MVDYKTKMIFSPTTSLRMEVIEAGEGPLMVMLHGFPEMAQSWRRQIEYFSNNGRRVVAPNMRGYGATDRPRNGYDVDTLCYDIAGVLDHYGVDKAVLAGHDWGGVVAWHFAYLFPGRLQSLVILNAPHPVKFERELTTNRSQLLKSWYTLAFQIPFLSEMFLGFNGAKMVGKLINRTAIRKDVFSLESQAAYSKNMNAPGALSAGIAYYRSALRNAIRLRKFYRGKKITTPTLVIWAQNDVFLGPELADGLERYIDAPLEVVPIPNCGHWVNQEAYEEVNAAIEKFIGRRPA